MESGVQSSFIPHDAGSLSGSPRVRSNGLGDLLLVLSIVALAASGALAVAVFLYQQFLQSQSASDLAQIQRAQQQFQPALVQQLTRLDDRMHAAETILSAHMAPSAFFDVLDQVTLKTVSYTTLALDATDPQHIEVKMQGVAQSVNSIALQGDLMSQSQVFTSPIFSNISRQKDGVHFDLTALVNPAQINFVQLASGSGTPAPSSARQQSGPPAPAGTSSAPASGAPSSTSTAPAPATQ